MAKIYFGAKFTKKANIFWRQIYKKGKYILAPNLQKRQIYFGAKLKKWPIYFGAEVPKLPLLCRYYV
jgi:hypothetical protein